MGTDLQLQLNELLTSLYSDIRDVEEKALIKDDFADITYNDMHVIEAIGTEEPKNSSFVAKKLHVTMGTLTKSIDGLVNKGYVRRERSDSDKRKVLLSLLDKGISAYNHHARFHKDMVTSVLSQLNTDEDAAVLQKMLGGLSGYFKTMKE